MSENKIEAAALARQFHKIYERLAPDFGYKTREASAKPWDEVPEQNKQLMIAVCTEILHRHFGEQRAVERRAHKVMTRKEYDALNLKGWHEVCHNYDGFGATGIRYIGED